MLSLLVIHKGFGRVSFFFLSSFVPVISVYPAAVKKMAPSSRGETRATLKILMVHISEFKLPLVGFSQRLFVGALFLNTVWVFRQQAWRFFLDNPNFLPRTKILNTTAFWNAR